MLAASLLLIFFLSTNSALAGAVNNRSVSSRKTSIPGPGQCVDIYPGQSIYVDNQNKCGPCNDTGPGTINNPVCTVREGLDRLDPNRGLGKTKVLIRNGIYRLTYEYGNFNIQGSPANYIEVMNYPNESPKIYLSQHVTNWRQYMPVPSGSIPRKNIWYVDWMLYVDPWFITYNIPHAPQMMVIDDTDPPVKLQQVNSRQVTRCLDDYLPPVRTNQNDMIAGDFYYDPATKRLYVWLPDSSNPNIHKIEVGLSRTVQFTVRYMRFSGLDIRYSGSENVQCGWPMFVVNGDHNIVENNKINYADSGGMGGRCDDCLLRNNSLSSNGNSGAGFFGTNTLIENNTIWHNNWRRYNPNWHAGGIKIIPDGRFTTIRNNSVAHNYGQGIWLDTMAEGNVIENNFVFDNSASNIMVEITRGTPQFPTIVRNNIIYDCPAVESWGIYISSSDNTEIYNNLISGCDRNIIVHGLPRSGYTLFNNRARNNIILNPSQAAIMIAEDSPTSGNNRADYNIYWRTDGTSPRYVIGWWLQVYNGLAAWQAGTGQDTHSIEINPRLVNIAGGDFHLTRSSPAINRGTDVGYYFDRDGRRRDSRIDIGPYEYILKAISPPNNTLRSAIKAVKRK